MSDESRELALFAENDGDLYRQRIEPILRNLARKKAKGIYDPVKALILWKYAADDAAQRYTKQFDTPRPGNSYGIFTPQMRRDTARELAEYYEDQIDDFLPAKRRANPSRRSLHTSKWDRCVRDVKAKGEAADPYAVCTASLGVRSSVKAKHRRRNPAGAKVWMLKNGDSVIVEKLFPSGMYEVTLRSAGGELIDKGRFDDLKDAEVYRRNFMRASRRQNPVNGFLLTVKNTANGQRAYYTGEEAEAFDSNRARARVYASAAEAQAAMRALSRHHRLKPGWRYAVAVAARANPESAERLYTRFHGEPPRRLKTRELPQFRRGLEIGPVAAITYDTLRDGKTIRFEHEFSPRAAPLLIASDSGRTLALTGGRYQFTERGIIDRAK